jgi:beta-lactamase regulating signal transducer with metallopeptidase domain
VLEHDGVLSKRWPLAIFAAWLLTALLLTGRVLLSYRHLARLRSNATPLAAVYQERLQSLLQSCRARRPISLGCSQEITGPVVVGLARPVILFPESLLGRLTEAEFDMVVLHELAHVRRLDDWTNAVQKIIEAVFFFHPLVLWLRGRLDLEREIACDDLVVSVTHEQKRYALCLTKLVEHVGEPRRPSTAVGAGLVKKQIFSRVELLVSSRRRRGFGSRLTTVAGVAVWLLSMSSVLLVYAMFVPTVRLSQSVHAADAMRAAASTTQSLHDAPTAKSSAVALINAPETATIIRRESSASITKDAARRRAMTASPHRNASSPHVAPRRRQGGQSLEDSLRAAAKISSDVEKTDALVEWAAHCPDDDAALSAYLETTATINSANQKERALMALLSRERLSRQILSKVLTIATDDLGSQQSRQKIMNEVMTHLSD